MGQAKQRKLAIDAIDRDILGQALRETVNATTSVQGADCILYALVGAQTLRDLGVSARAVAGSALWRVGSGDGDVISHDAAQAINAVFPVGKASKAGMFHAWIEYDSPDGVMIVDFTTWQLKDKARALDEADGGRTQVDFCPPFLWEKAPGPKSLHEAAQAPHGGAFGYRRVSQIEALVFSQEAIQETVHIAAATRMVYESLKRGDVMKVVGIDRETGEMQTADEAPTLRPAAILHRRP